MAAAAAARPGDTITLADGRYPLARPLALGTDRLTVRGASGDRDKVVLDGDGIGEGVRITAGCTGVTVADLTVQNIRWNPIRIDAGTGV